MQGSTAVIAEALGGDTLSKPPQPQPTGDMPLQHSSGPEHPAALGAAVVAATAPACQLADSAGCPVVAEMRASGERYFTIEAYVVGPEHRGKGYGGAAMRQLLAAVDTVASSGAGTQPAGTTAGLPAGNSSAAAAGAASSSGDEQPQHLAGHVLLLTQTERNVAMYRRFGFRLIGDTEIVVGERKVPSYVMHRLSPAAAAAEAR